MKQNGKTSEATAMVIGAYGSAAGYQWHPATNDPDYLRIDRPRFDFVSVAKVFGIEQGEVRKSTFFVLLIFRIWSRSWVVCVSWKTRSRWW